MQSTRTRAASACCCLSPVWPEAEPHLRLITPRTKRSPVESAHLCVPVSPSWLAQSREPQRVLLMALGALPGCREEGAGARGLHCGQDAPGRCPAVWSVSAAVGTTPARQGIQRKDHCQGKGDKGKEMREDVAAATCRHKSLALLVTSLISY